MLETKRLVAEWEHWTRVAGMTGTLVHEGDRTNEIRFCSDNGHYELKRDDGWWVIDESDDRGQWYRGTATFSTIDLVEKYLVWTWGSLARTAVGAEQLGRHFQQQGFNVDLRQTLAARANFVELTIPDGVAVVPISMSVILSHVLALSLTRLDDILRTGM